MTVAIELNQNIYDGTEEDLNNSIADLEVLMDIIQRGTAQLDGLADGMRVDCYEDYVTMMSRRTKLFDICTSAIDSIEKQIYEKTSKIEVGNSLKTEKNKEKNYEQN